MNLTTISAIDLTNIKLFVEAIEYLKKGQQPEPDKDCITNTRQIKSHIRRLDTLFQSYANFNLLWRDRVCESIGLNAEAIRWELEQYREMHKAKRYTASFYEAIDSNSNYLCKAIKVIKEMNREYGVYQTIYRQSQMTEKDEDVFSIAKVIDFSNEECEKWYNNRIVDISNMCYCDTVKAKKIFIGALVHNMNPYNPRIYGDKFSYNSIGYEFNHISDPKSKIFNCDSVSPYRQIPREKIREYMVIVARDCLVV